MQKNVLNKKGTFGVKILWRYTDMAIFVLRCFILTHPVDSSDKAQGPGSTGNDKAYSNLCNICI